MTPSSQINYIPDQQDIIYIDFNPSVGEEIRKRRPALVLSSQNYSRVTDLAVVCPITSSENNRLKDFFIPVSGTSTVHGYINPLQFHTFDYKKRHAQKVGLLPTSSFIEAKQTILDLLE
ncbi:type II toxin-antitoxin system PemK/MazF family toxin [Oenococcus sp.]|uniref:type II toxin-antitoxin system PemK/MazF family toxin n=1 Tax=Oenococcus sp. TaxID=1979414 RepID=UPI0039EBB037